MVPGAGIEPATNGLGIEEKAFFTTCRHLGNHFFRDGLQDASFELEA